MQLCAEQTADGDLVEREEPFHAISGGLEDGVHVGVNVTKDPHIRD